MSPRRRSPAPASRSSARCACRCPWLLGPMAACRTAALAGLPLAPRRCCRRRCARCSGWPSAPPSPPAPGGQGEMVVLALAADAPFVVTHHLVRITAVLRGAPRIGRRARR